MRTVKYLSILLAVAMVLPLVACGGAGGSKVLKIGVIAPMTGDAKTFGESTLEGVQLAVKEWNAKGGVLGKQLEIVLGDDKGDPAEASNAGTKMIKQDGLKFIVGSVMSSCSIPISEIANANQVVQISPTSTNERLTVDPWPGGTRKPYVFRACFIDSFQGLVMANFALNTLKVKTAAIFYDNGNAYVVGLASNFQQAFEAGGGTVVVNEAYAKTDTDFSALLTKVVAENPDMLYIPDYYQMVSLIAKQARDLGYPGILAGGDGWDSADLDFAATEGGYFTNHYSSGDTRPEVVNFIKAYGEEFKAADGSPKVPDALATLAYDATYLLLNAMKTAGSEDTTKVRDALAATKDYGVVSGTISMDEFGNPQKDATMLQIKDGKQVYVATVGAK